jgi:hypothetical protein
MVGWEMLLDELLADPRVEKSQMMGHQCAKVSGKMFVSCGDDAFVYKLPRERVNELVASGEGEPFDPGGTGRVMKEWVRVPALADEAREFVLSQIR